MCGLVGFCNFQKNLTTDKNVLIKIKGKLVKKK